MNIGFYGKGGSGKTTISALFSSYLDSIGYGVALLDVDVNSHTAEVIGAKQDVAKLLSIETNEQKIKEYLAGNNYRVKVNEFLNTTPPGRGSNLWEICGNNLINDEFGNAFGNNSKVFTVGSYKPEKIGLGCHHGNQSIAENMISHARIGAEEALVIDSVAGNDAFGTSLYLNDLLVYIVKPEREGIAVMNRFISLAEHSNVIDRLVILGNNVSVPAQTEFLKKEVPKELLAGIIELNNSVIEYRLADKPISSKLLNANEIKLFNKLLSKAKSLSVTGGPKRFEELKRMHKKVSAESWVAGSYRKGLADQIDNEYEHSYPKD